MCSHLPVRIRSYREANEKLVRVLPRGEQAPFSLRAIPVWSYMHPVHARARSGSRETFIAHNCIIRP